MANALNPSTVATNIAAISVSGLTIKDLNNFPKAPTSRDCPVMIPKMQYVDGVEAVPQAFGAGTMRPWNVTYYVNYRILYAPVGQERTPADLLQAMTTLFAAIVTAILQSDVSIGSEESVVFSYENMGVVMSPNDDQFFGFDMRIQIMEYLS